MSTTTTQPSAQLPLRALVRLQHDGDGADTTPNLLLLEISRDFARRLEASFAAAAFFPGGEVHQRLGTGYTLFESVQLLSGEAKDGSVVSIAGPEGERIDNVHLLSDFYEDECGPECKTVEWEPESDEDEDEDEDEESSFPFRVSSAWVQAGDGGHDFLVELWEKSNEDTLIARPGINEIPGLADLMAEVRHEVAKDLCASIMRRAPAPEPEIPGEGERVFEALVATDVSASRRIRVRADDQEGAASQIRTVAAHSFPTGFQIDEGGYRGPADFYLSEPAKDVEGDSAEPEIPRQRG